MQGDTSRNVMRVSEGSQQVVLASNSGHSLLQQDHPHSPDEVGTHGACLDGLTHGPQARWPLPGSWEPRPGRGRSHCCWGGEASRGTPVYATSAGGKQLCNLPSVRSILCMQLWPRIVLQSSHCSLCRSPSHATKNSVLSAPGRTHKGRVATTALRYDGHFPFCKR